MEISSAVNFQRVFKPLKNWPHFLIDKHLADSVIDSEARADTNHLRIKSPP